MICMISGHGTKADHVIGVEREEFASALEGKGPPPRAQRSVFDDLMGMHQWSASYYTVLSFPEKFIAIHH